MRIVVIGAGIIGLTAAHALRHRGHEVGIVAAELSGTASARAGASFKPSSLDHSPRNERLLVASHAALVRWDQSGFTTHLGITRAVHYEASARPLAPRTYLHVMDDVEALDVAGDIPGGYPHAIRYTTWFFDVPVVLAGLRDHLDRHGVAVTTARLDDLDDPALADLRPELVVNAAGLGARTLVGDDLLVPIRGQTMTVPRSVAPELGFSISADDRYVYPRRDDILLGGTREYDNGDLTPDPATAAHLREVNARIVPALLDAAPGTSQVGLRPYLPGGPRLEVDTAGPRPVVHAYGHGGAGWTLAAGTAEWVADTVDRLQT